MITNQRTSPQPGIVVSTAITAGAAGECPIGTCNGQNNHVEGVVVSTAITAGAADDCPIGTCNDQNNHAEGLVRR